MLEFVREICLLAKFVLVVFILGGGGGIGSASASGTHIFVLASSSSTAEAANNPVPVGRGGVFTPNFGRYMPQQSEKVARAPERAPRQA